MDAGYDAYWRHNYMQHGRQQLLIFSTFLYTWNKNNIDITLLGHVLISIVYMADSRALLNKLVTVDTEQAMVWSKHI